MADSNDSDNGVTIDRSGPVPSRRDNRGILHMMHDELGKALGIGQSSGAGKHIVDGKAQTVDDVVNDAVNGAKGANPDY